MRNSTCYIIGLFLGFLMGILLVLSITNDSPTAMDVYKGKTCLKYILIDSIKIDSTVIFKVGL